MLRLQPRDGTLEDPQLLVVARLALRIPADAPSDHRLPQRLEHSVEATFAAALAKRQTHRDTSQPVATTRPPVEGACDTPQVEERGMDDVVGIGAIA
jgi:hypothetical protein